MRRKDWMLCQLLAAWIFAAGWLTTTLQDMGNPIFWWLRR